MPSDGLLKQFGLHRNPFTDRTAEKTQLDDVALYVHSDLQGFTPSETTYVFFGRRGSGKTTIRLKLQAAYEQENERAEASGRSRGHFMVDLCRPGHLTACLRNFQEATGSTNENWDAQLGVSWASADLVDCILSYAATELVRVMTDAQSEAGRDMLQRVRADERGSKQLLLLAHLYAITDAASLAALRRELLRPRLTTGETIATGAATTAAIAGATLVARDPETVGAPLSRLWETTADSVPLVGRHPRAAALACSAAGLACAAYYYRWRRRRELERAAALTAGIRVVKPQPVPLVAALLARLFSPQDGVDTIRSLCIGVSAHQKLDHLTHLVRLLGYDSVAVFGDCFDEVSLLDPVQFPGALKVFAREICRNDLLNFGRLHFFFPDSRLALDLNTDKTLKEARFDRHFVRDLTWSRHQLEELAERRFVAAQRHELGDAQAGEASFADLFKQVRVEDYSSYLSKLQTPRELMLMMTEVLARAEAFPDKGLEAQDMEIAVTKALEQAV